MLHGEKTSLDSSKYNTICTKWQAGQSRKVLWLAWVLPRNIHILGRGNEGSSHGQSKRVNTLHHQIPCSILITLGQKCFRETFFCQNMPVCQPFTRTIFPIHSSQFPVKTEERPSLCLQHLINQHPEDSPWIQKTLGCRFKFLLCIKQVSSTCLEYSISEF